MTQKYRFFVVPALLLSLTASANYRTASPPIEQCEVLLLPDSKPVSGWSVFKRALTQLDVRDVIFGRGKELSLSDKAIIKASMLPSSAKVEIKSLDATSSIELNLKDDASRALCLLELPENSPIVLNGDSHIGGLLAGKPGEPRYLVHQRNDRSYRLELDWRQFTSMRVPEKTPLNPSMYALVKAGTSPALMSGEFGAVYQDFGNALVRNAMVASLSERQTLMIETSDGQRLVGELKKSGPSLEIVETKPDQESVTRKLTVKFSWNDVVQVRVSSNQSIPEYNSVELQKIPAIKKQETHSDANIQFGTSMSNLIPDAKEHSMVSVDVGMEKPLVGVLLRGNPLTLMVRNSSDGYLDVVVDGAQVRGAAKGWAADNALLSGQDVFVDGYGMGKVIEIGADRSLVLENENQKIEIPGSKVKSALLATEEVAAFAKAFGAKELSVVFAERKSFRDSGGDSWSERYYSNVHFRTMPSVGIPLYEISGNLEKYGGSDGYGSHSSTSVGSPVTLPIDQAPVLFRSAELTAAEVMEVIKALPKNVDRNGSFRIIRNDDGSFLLAVWQGEGEIGYGGGRSTRSSEEVAKNLLASFHKLGTPEYHN